MSSDKIRIKDIALKANISIGTVDRVLHKRGKVKPEIEAKVLKILKEMNYKPNLIARVLSSKKNYKIVALIPNPEYDLYWMYPKEGLDKAYLELKEYGISLIVEMFNPNSVESFRERASEVLTHAPDGIIVSPIFYREVLPFFKSWKENNIPFVLFNTQIPEIFPLCYVGQDSYQSGLLAGRLVHYGQNEPCTVLVAHFDEELLNAAHLTKKEKGFRDYFTQRKLDGFHIICEELNSSDYSKFLHQMDNLTEMHPHLNCIFVTNSNAYKIASYLNERHISKIKVIGYDLIPKNIIYLKKGLINFLINQNAKGQGFWSLQLLTQHLVLKKDIPNVKYLPLDVVTNENLNYYIDESE